MEKQLEEKINVIFQKVNMLNEWHDEVDKWRSQVDEWRTNTKVDIGTIKNNIEWFKYLLGALFLSTITKIIYDVLVG